MLRLLALDFDGVISDSAPESFVVALLTYTQMIKCSRFDDRRAALESVGVYDERSSRCQDYDLWLRMAARFKVANLDEPTLRYRVSPTQGKRSHLRETLKLTLEIQRRWMFRRPFFRPGNVLYVGLEHALLLLPEPLVLVLFKRVTYAKR